MARKKVSIVLRQPQSGGQWEAYAKDGTLVTYAHDVPTLRKRLPGVLGEGVEIDETIELSPKLRQELEGLRADTQALNEATEKLRARRIRIAKTFLQELRFGQGEAAAFMGLAQSRLNKILLEDATGKQPGTLTRKAPP